MAKQAKVISVKTAMKTTQSTGVTGNSTEDDGDFVFGWEGLSVEPLIFEARSIVDNVWPNTDTPDIVNGVWDHTPIMHAVLVAIRRGIEIGRGAEVASA